MNPHPNLESASGLRPASAFFAIAVVLGLAAIWVGSAALGADVSMPRREQVEKDPPPAYDIVDRSGRPMALFVQRLRFDGHPTFGNNIFSSKHNGTIYCYSLAISIFHRASIVSSLGPARVS